MAVADGAILRVVASLLFPENVIAQNVFYCVFADTGTSDDEDDVVDDLATWVEDMYDHFNTVIADTVDLTGIKVYNYDVIDDDWDEVGDAVLSDSFGSGSDILVHGVAMVIHAKTTDPDVQAAKFIGGFSEPNTEDGLFVASALVTGVNFAVEWSTAFVGAITGAQFGPGVWSVKNQNFFLFSGTEVINAIPGYQRRRKPGVGI